MNAPKTQPDEMMAMLLSEAGRLPPVNSTDAVAYRGHLEQLAAFVDARIEADPTLALALAGVPRELCRSNHRNHARFLTAVFELGAWEVLMRTVVWVYRSYRARGLPPGYFPAVVDSFRDAVRTILPSSADGLDPAYAMLLRNHEAFLELSNLPAFSPAPRSPELRDRFLQALLRADAGDLIHTTRQAVTDRVGVAPFYLEVVEPAMTEVGRLWESGTISVAQEHVASALAQRAMASLYERFVMTSPHRGRALVLCATGELHEMGARMVADLLEMDGWDVCYLGADVPSGALKSVLDPPPFLAAISASMFSHVPRVRETVALLRANPLTAFTRILVGGRAFIGQPELAARIGADSSATTAVQAVHAAAAGWSQRPH